MLEAAHHTDNVFVTLTYDDDHLPEDGSLNPRDVQLFLKRLRVGIAPIKVRYFAVGEYGEQTGRPHYHMALFGYPGCLQGVSNWNKSGSCCDPCNRLRQHWELGHTYSGVLTDDSAQYIAGYTVKKMTNPDDERLDGRHPEFARMSLKPAIGSDLLWDVASSLMQYDLVQGDVPAGLREGARIWPLGRTLRRKLRARVGMDERAPDATLAQMEAELLPMRAAAQEAAPGLRTLAFKAHIVQAGEGRRRRLMVKQRAKKGVL